jgi:type IV secretory pathway VirB10-like protein
MIVQLLLLTQLIACEDTKETPPPPPPPPVDVKKEEPKPEVKKEEPTPEEKPVEAVSMEGTKPKVDTKTKKITTGELKAAQCKLLTSNAKRQLKARAKKEGFTDVKDVALIKTTPGNPCKGIGQGTAYKTTVTYSAGNAVAVKQDDKSKKNAIIKEVTDGKYVVTYEDKTEETVEKSALSIRK